MYSGWTIFEVFQGVSRGERPPLDEIASMCEPLAVLIERCWQTDPNLRPDFQEIAAELKEISHNLQKESRTMSKIFGKNWSGNSGSFMSGSPPPIVPRRQPAQSTEDANNLKKVQDPDLIDFDDDE